VKYWPVNLSPRIMFIAFALEPGIHSNILTSGVIPSKQKTCVLDVLLWSYHLRQRYAWPCSTLCLTVFIHQSDQCILVCIEHYWDLIRAHHLHKHTAIKAIYNSDNATRLLAALPVWWYEQTFAQHGQWPVDALFHHHSLLGDNDCVLSVQ